jgi:hypothetical protein
MMFEQRYRPGRDAENEARAIVRSLHLTAMSAYCESRAVVYDDVTGKVPGIAMTGGEAVEMAWQDAATRAAQA